MAPTRETDDGAVRAEAMLAAAADPSPDALQSLLQSRPVRQEPLPTLPAVMLGELVALADDGRTLLVRYAGQPGAAALPARSVVDVHAPHIGRGVVLAFEHGDPLRPIVMGVLTEGAPAWPLAPVGGQVELDADGQRMVVSAQHELVLRCGKASITLSKTGRIVIAGEEVSTRATGLNRVLGGSVQIN